MPNTGVKEAMYEVLKSYICVEDGSMLKDLAPFAISCFLAIFALLLTVDGNYFLIFIVLGFGLGAFYFNNRDSSFKIEKYERNLSYTDQALEQFSNSAEPPKQVELYYPPLTTVVNQLLDYVMRDFVSSWWSTLNIHKDVTFERLARERLNVVFLNVQKILLNQERNDIVMSTVYGVANTLIIHMRECRALEDSGLTMDTYVVENPQSPFAQLLSKEEQHRQLRGLSQTFLRRTIPAPDKDSLLLMSLFKELLATYLFGGVLDSLSDPDFLNCWIIDLLSDKEKANAISSTLSAAVLGENDGPIVGLAERATELCASDEDIEKVRHSAEEDDNSTRSSVEQVTPPDTPEPLKSSTQFKTTPVVTTCSKNNDSTVLASLQSPPPAQSPWGPQSMIFAPGSVNFTVMDISSPQLNDQPLDKTELVYIIQIERPAMDDHAGSEGGGYVITRTYADFQSFNTILTARHVKRAAKLQLKLPLDSTAKSWLKKPSAQQRKKMPMEAISQGLEKYIDTVVQDEELGTDQIILPFLRKEQRSEVADGGNVVSFAEEYKDEVATVHALADPASTNTAKSRSLFSRSSSSTLNSMNNSSSGALNSQKTDFPPSTEEDANTKWFAPITKLRKDSISSMHSTFSKDSSVTVTKDEDEENEDDLKKSPLIAHNELEDMENKPKHTDTPSNNNNKNNKALSAMDVELLIETTYALIVEIFNLTTSNNKAWMRRSILNLLREIVRRSYAQFISEQYSDFVNEYMSPDAIVSVLNQLGEQFWPEGKWMLEGKDQTKRTEEDKEKSRQLARSLMMTELIPNAVRQLIGDQNCNTAMDRMWARCQDPNLNRVLILQVLERIIKPILG